MRYILIILVFLSVGANAQMVIKAHANYRPYAQPAANLLLDDYPNAAAAYSLRKLDKDYTGACIRIRRDSTGQAETDIGFDASGVVDSNAIKNFIRNNTGYIVTWYDQSGNNRDATQSISNRQPTIVESNVLRRNPITNKILAGFTNTLFPQGLLTSNITLSGNMTMFGAYNVTANPVGTTYGIFSYGEESNAKRRTFLIWNGGSGTTYYHYASAFAQNVQLSVMTTSQNVINYSLFNHTSQEISGGINGVAATTGARTLTNPAASPIYIGRTGSGENMVGNVYELILYNSNQSSNRTGIESNINTYYGIY